MFRGKLGRPGILTILALASAIVAFRVPRAPDSSFDGCWRYVLASASSEHLDFGRDLIFAYGPLGWVAAPIASGHQQFSLFVLLTAIALASGAAVAWLVSRTTVWWQSGLVLLLALGAFAFSWPRAVPSIEPDYQLVFVTYVTIATLSIRMPLVAGAIAGTCVGLATGMKIIAFVDTVAPVGVGMLFVGLSNWRKAATAVLAALASSIIVGASALAGPIYESALGHLIRGSREVSMGYSGAMADPSLPGEARAAIASVLVGIAFLIWCAKGGRVVFSLVSLSVLLLGWKHATIREDLSHASYLYATLGLIAATAIASGISRRQSIVAGAIGVLALGHLATLFLVYHHAPPPSIDAAEIRNPPLRWSGRTIDALPHDDVTAIRSTGIYDPLPMFQLETAYTPYLDALDATALASRGAETVLYRYTSIDDRYPFADAPAVVRSLLCMYVRRSDVVSRDGRPFVELQRGHDDTCRSVPATAVSQQANGEIRIPSLAEGELLAAYISLGPSARASIDTILSRPSPPYLVFSMKDGSTVRRRIVAATANDGIVVDPAPLTQQEASDLFARALPGNVRLLRVDSGPDYIIRSVRFERVSRYNRVATSKSRSRRL